MFRALSFMHVFSSSKVNIEKIRSSKALFLVKNTLSKESLSWSTTITSNFQHKSGACVLVQYFKSNPECSSEHHTMDI